MMIGCGHIPEAMIVRLFRDPKGWFGRTKGYKHNTTEVLRAEVVSLPS